MVRTITSLHAITREVREQVDATADTAAAFADTAIGLERRLAAPETGPEPPIELPVFRNATRDAGDEESGEEVSARGGSAFGRRT